MASGDISTKQKILSIIDDIEIITKELLEVLTAAKTQPRPNSSESNMLMELLIQKDKDLKEMLKIAQEQAEIEKTMVALKAEVQIRDTDIKTLQTNLNDAETILSTAVYQAKQKLGAVRQANNNQVPSEDLIKYAHRISASNAVSAPPTWAPGDPRRPYPTEFEMRLGYLGKLADISLSSQSHLSYSDILGPTQSHSIEPVSISSAPSSSSTMWHPQEVSQTVSRQTTVESRSHHKDSEEVGYMSSDSSSSSSSDE